MIAAYPSFAEPMSSDSATKVLNCVAIAYASSIVVAYWRMCLANSDIGIAEDVGVEPFAALIVIVSPCSLIPESTPIIPGHEIEA